MGLTTLFRAHVAEISRMCEKALAVCAEISREHAAEGPPVGAEYGGIVFHAGTSRSYHADDRGIPFRSLPHFARFAPVPGPEHLLVFRPGRTPRLGRVVPRDYWYEAPSGADHPFAEVLEAVEAPSLEAVALLLGDLSDCAYVGEDPAVARRVGVSPDAVEPPALLAPLDWYRGFKTDYEVACIRQAAGVAGLGHAVARVAAAAGASEREIHAAYLEATGHLDHETPYPNIVAWDDRAAILHYGTKRRSRPSPGHTFLIDAGACVHGYASDVTRTYVREGVHPAFQEALTRLEALQAQLVARVAPGVGFVELHAEAIAGIAAILVDIGVLRVGVGEALESGFALPFMPHGLGHHLGLQVHDVGGRQVTREGEHRPPPDEHPYLRTTRELDAGHVVTIEPGLYFIPLLLEPFRSGAGARAFAWKLVDELCACGGIRIEDDVLVKETGVDNLSRAFVPGSDPGSARDPG